jgi:hypothetical protein
MRVTAILAVVLVCAAGLWAQEGTPQGSVRLTGRVIAADTGDPLRGATVTVSAAGRSVGVASADHEGRFEFWNLPAVSLSVSASKSGFISSSLGVATRGLPEGGAMNSRSVEIRLVRAAAIAGRVFDTFGDPTPDAVVQAFRVIYPLPGQRAIDTQRQATTNDLGEYRLYGLPAGTYYVAVRGTFYPGTALGTDALAIVVQGGDQALGTDIRLLSAQMSRVSGRVVDANGRPVPSRSAVLNPLQLDGGGLAQRKEALVDGRGEFVFNSVPPGAYRIDVIRVPFLVDSGRSGSVPTYTSVPRDTGSALVTVPAEGTIGDVVIQLTPGRELRGRVLIDGAIPSVEGLRMTSTQMGLENVFGVIFSYGATALVGPDGSFLLRGLGGAQGLGITGLPAGAALLRIVAHGLDITDDGVDMDRGDVVGVEVLVTTTPSVVRGAVKDPAGNAAPANVIVMAEDPRLRIKPRSRYVVSGPSSRERGFTFSGLPAGRYLAVAVTDLDRQMWADPANLERLARGATGFTLIEGGSVELTLVRR